MAAPLGDARRGEYAARMSRVLDPIQANLAEPLELERLAYDRGAGITGIAPD